MPFVTVTAPELPVETIVAPEAFSGSYNTAPDVSGLQMRVLPRRLFAGVHAPAITLDLQGCGIRTIEDGAGVLSVKGINH